MNIYYNRLSLDYSELVSQFHRQSKNNTYKSLKELNTILSLEIHVRNRKVDRKRRQGPQTPAGLPRVA